jgi:hypothetical protein
MRVFCGFSETLSANNETVNYFISDPFPVRCYSPRYLILSETDTDILLTPYSRVLLEKLTGFQLVKKFPAFYGTRRFITAGTSGRHLSLSCADTDTAIN